MLARTKYNYTYSTEVTFASESPASHEGVFHRYTDSHVSVDILTSDSDANIVRLILIQHPELFCVFDLPFTMSG